ncbi:MAG TPA: glucan biosynthesis protein D [Noviherbaspirillum sp.]|jgi:glucans biosynthesis protein|uniref:glucan biosynthesis protein n=1 Tax=Noviherbaspirillum sp. TaxID=1926288 RepID=UPI002F944530
MQRRHILRGLAALAAAGFHPQLLAAAARPRTTKFIGEARPFDYAWLKGEARQRAARAYQPVPDRVPADVEKLDWDQYQAIQYRADHALWSDDAARFQARFFHLGLFFRTPVQIHEVVDGRAREIAYDPAMFNYGKSGLNAAKLPKDLGFAGFRLNFHTDLTRDVAAFLGASYFRAVGSDWQYGLSARGLAIDCGMDRPEEFPNFTHFWLERPKKEAGRLVVYALLDSPSIAGAYRFEIEPGATLVMDVDVALYPRKTIERLGIAPLTSMYQFGENDRHIAAANDWRPEIHDSDGLSMWRGNGEWIWRPLTNPAQLRFNAYQDDSPKGFGLMQRDRDFDNYQDDGVFYDRRPSLWIEPKSNWGRGAIQLVEIPTVDETFDNIVAFWNPAEKPQAGQELLYSYRMHWGRQMPVNPSLATVAHTRTGIGGVVGQPRKHFSWRFVVDFVGGNLKLLGKDAKVIPVVTASRGEIELASARPLEHVQGYRLMFDLRPTDSNMAPIDLRAYMTAGGAPLCETWLYQWSPTGADVAQRG